MKMNQEAVNLCEYLKLKAPNGEIKIVTAESCTAGLIAASIADVPGSSKWLESGYVVYTPEAKYAMLNVKPETIEKFNITSNEVASEMAKGANELLRKRDSSSLIVSVGVTGVAGPSNDVPEIPVGTVCVGFMLSNNNKDINGKNSKMFFEKKLHLKGDRNEVRKEVVNWILKTIPEQIEKFTKESLF